MPNRQEQEQQQQEAAVTATTSSAAVGDGIVRLLFRDGEGTPRIEIHLPETWATEEFIATVNEHVLKMANGGGGPHLAT